MKPVWKCAFESPIASRIVWRMKSQMVWKPKLSLQQLYLLCQQLSFALNGGMSVPDALLLVGNEAQSALCRRFLLQIGAAVQQGNTMAQALQQSNIRYSPVLLEFVLAGEQNGTMGVAMTQAAEYFFRQNRTRQMLRSALFYPVVLLVLMFLAFAAMFLFVVPTVIQTYENFDAELPGMTQRILNVCDWLQAYGMFLLLLFSLLGFGGWLFRQYAGDPLAWKEWKKNVLLRIPVIGTLYQQYWFIQIGQMLGLMLSSGMLLLSGLQAAHQIYKRSLFDLELDRFFQALMEGVPFAIAMESCHFVPQMAKQMLVVSEQTGSLAVAFHQLSQYYQQQFQQKLQQIIGLLEPGFVILLGLGILFMTSSLFLPLVQSYQYLL